jgi:hypothetical protein
VEGSRLTLVKRFGFVVEDEPSFDYFGVATLRR